MGSCTRRIYALVVVNARHLSDFSNLVVDEACLDFLVPCLRKNNLMFGDFAEAGTLPRFSVLGVALSGLVLGSDYSLNFSLTMVTHAGYDRRWCRVLVFRSEGGYFFLEVILLEVWPLASND